MKLKLDIYVYNESFEEVLTSEIEVSNQEIDVAKKFKDIMSYMKAKLAKNKIKVKIVEMYEPGNPNKIGSIKEKNGLEIYDNRFDFLNPNMKTKLKSIW